MAKQLNVDMRFTADTSKAKQQITELQQAIQKLGYGSKPKDVVDPKQFEAAAASARELAYHLNNAYNTKTGNLDLSKLNSSLKQSGTDLNKLTANFKNAGTVGQQAFVSLAKAVASADQPAITLNTHLSTMFTTLKNVARFQISSSIMHGLIGGIQTAYGYAQDLNESLNNIRIVTGQNTDQMAQFARQANEAARALSATTLDYTNASLIYYQQGLSDSEVRERTDVTIKMANVARESAETVSEQMTAIWNNFDDGSKSLEYYADVITALGAATASSSSEISEGLNKFAAVADTVGLSYENATAALATITATTRQSADTVGTGLRTLFSRLQGLSLGETLEDGVNLNKYSKALQTVGVQALDASGNLRSMDEVLEDLGARWGELSEAQQTALAQTVGGVRQYTTLIALMDNWDFMKQNQQVAAGASGTLQKQADIYAESWEAARDRVKAATEALYSSLIDEDFFIGVDNVVEHVLVGINKFTEGFGGIQSLLVSILSFVLSMTANKIGPAVQKIVQDIQILSGGSNKVYQKMQGEFNDATNAELKSGKYDNSPVMKAELESSQALLAAKTKLGMVNEQLSSSERMRAEMAMQGYELEAAEIKKLAQEVENLAQKEKEAADIAKKANEEKALAEQHLNDVKANVARTGTVINKTAAMGRFSDVGLDFTKLNKDIDTATTNLRDKLKSAFLEGSTGVEQLGGKFSQSFKDIASGVNEVNLGTKINELKYMKEVYGDFFKELNINSNTLNKLFDKAFNADTPQKFKTAVQDIGKTLTSAGIPADKLQKALTKLGAKPETLKNYNQALKEYQDACKKAEQASSDDATAKEKLKSATENLIKAQTQLNKEVQNFQPTHTVSPIEGITKGAAVMGQVVTMVNALKGAFQTLGDESATTGEKLTACFMAVSMGVPAAIGAYKNLVSIAGAFTDTTVSQAIAQKLFGAALTESQTQLAAATAAEQTLAAVKGVAAAEDQAAAAAEQILTAAKVENITVTEAGESVTLSWAIAKKVAAGASLEEAVNALASEGAISSETGAKILNAKATQKQTIANIGLKASMIEVIAIIAVVAAAIAGIVALYKIWSNAYNADAIAAKNAAAAAEELAQASEEAKQEADKLRASIEKYDSAVDKLKNCTKGTKEWAEAFKEVQAASKDALANIGNNLSAEDYDKLRKTYIENGFLDEELLIKAQKSANIRADTAAYSADVGNYLASATSVQASQTSLARQMARYDIDVQAGNVNKEYVAQSINGILDKNITELAQCLDATELRSKLAELGVDVSMVNDATMGSWLTSIQNMTDAATQAAAKLGLISKIRLDDIYGDKYSDEAKSFAIAGQDEYIEERAKEYKKLFAHDGDMTFMTAEGEEKSFGGISKGDDNDSDVYQYLLERLQTIEGFEGALAASNNNGVIGTDSSRQFVFNINGKDETFGADFLANKLAAQDALKHAEVDMQTFNEISSKLSVAGQSFLDSIALGFNESTKKIDFTDYFSNMSKAEIEALQAADTDDKKALLLKNFGISEEDLQAIADQFGIGIDDVVDSFYSGADTVLQGYKEVGLKLTTTPQTIFNDTLKNTEEFNKLELVDQEKVTSLYQKVFNTIGEEGTIGLTNILKNLDAESQKTFTDLASSFDWTTSSVTDFKKQLVEAGIDVNAIDFDSFINAMHEGAKIAPSLEDTQKEFENLHKIIDKIKTGDTISAEDFNKYFSDMGDYFALMGDGTYKLIGDAKEFYNAINQRSIDNFGDRLQENNDKINRLNSYTQYTGNYALETSSYDSNEGFSSTTAKAQLDILNAFDFKDETGQIQEIQKLISEGQQLTAEQANYLFETIKKVTAGYEDYDAILEKLAEDNLELQTSIATSATSTADLAEYTTKYGLSGEAQAKGLQVLATQYDDCADELEIYNKLIREGRTDTDEFTEAQSNLWKAVAQHEVDKSAIDEYKRLHNVIDKLDVGGTISEDTFHEMFEGMDEYFVKMADGTMKLVGDAEEFYDAVNAKNLKQFEDSASAENRLINLSEDSWNYLTSKSATSFSDKNVTTAAALTQIDTLKAIGANDKEGKINEYYEALRGENKRDLNTEEYQELFSLFEKYTVGLETYANMMDQANKVSTDYLERIATSARSVGELQDRTAEYNLAQDQVIQGYRSLATSTEEGRKALSVYNQEMRKAGNDTAKIQAATDKFTKSIKNIEATKAAENIHKLIDELDELDEFTAEDVAKELRKVFGKDVTAEWVQNNQDLINQWLNGTEQERQEAANTIDVMTGMMEALTFDDADQAMDYLVDQLSASSTAADMFASHFSAMQQLVSTGAAELDGITFDINGTADMSAVIQSMIAAGATAEQLASYIQGLNFSDVQFSLNGETIAPPPDLMDNPEGFVEWWNNNIASRRNISNIRATGKWVKDSGMPAMSSGGSGGSGGGGGGGSKSKEEKKPVDEKTRYHTITQQLEDLKNAYDDISKARERAFGQNKSKLLEAETKNIEKQIAAQKKYIAEIRKYLYESEKGRPSDKAAVEALGAEFDANGVITNYDSLIDELVRKYNEGVKKFNAGDLDEDKFKEQYEEPFNEAREAIDQYVESINLLQEQEYALGDMQDDLADKLREQIEYKVELHVELNEDDLKVIDYQLKHLGDDAVDAMEKLKLLGDKINITMDNINTYQKGINDLLSQHLDEAEMQDFYDGKLTVEDLQNKGFTEEDVNTLRDYRDKLLEANEALIEMREEMEGQFLRTLDHYNEKIDKTQERFDQITKMAEHYKNIVDIVGKDKLGFDDEALEALDTTLVESANGKLASETKQLEELKKIQEDVQATLDSGDFGEHDEKFWKDQLEEVTDRVHEQEEEWAQAFEDSVTAVRQKLENSIERATQKAKELAGLTDSVLKLKDFVSSVDEITVGDADKMYQLTKLNREIEASMAGTNNNRSKKELLELQKKINDAMRDGQKYSQQDLDLLQKEFELKKAQLALEETENAKTTVRMSRDNEGNWGYVYTADEDQMDQAQQNLDDKIYEYNKAVEETIEHFTDLGADITQQYWDLRNEILLDTTLTAEEQQRQLQILDDKYAEAMSQMRRETEFYTEQSAVLYEKQYVARAVALDIIKEANDEEVLERANALQLLNEGEENNAALARERLAQLTGDRAAYYEAIKKLGDDELAERALQLGAVTEAELKQMQETENGVELLQQAIMNHYAATEEDTARHTIAVGEQQGILQTNEEKVAETFQATPLAQATGLKTMEEQVKTYLGTSEGLIKDSDTAIGTANKEMEKTFTDAGISVDGFKKKVEDFAEAMTKPDGEIDTTKKAAEQLAKDMTEATKGVADFLKKWQTEYGTRVDLIIGKNTDLAKSVGSLLLELSKVDDIPEDYGEESGGGDEGGTGGGSTRPTGESGEGSGSGESGEGPGSGPGSGGVYVTSVTGWISNPLRHWKVRAYSNGHTEIIDRDTHEGHWNYTTTHKTCSVCGYQKELTNEDEYQKVHLKTGGYTGTWSAASGRTGMYTGSWNGPDIEPNGRLAFLHQKELVLNADDTQNMLTAVKYVREIANMIDLSAGMRSRGIGEITPWISDMPKEERIEQEVHIEASFPSVISHSEIEEAFKNIIGKASQFAYRK